MIVQPWPGVPSRVPDDMRFTRDSIQLIVAIALVNACLFLVIANRTGRLVENGGRGWDGAAYLDMLRDRVAGQASNERLRPLVVLLNRPLYWLSDRSMDGAIDAFASMNVVYIAWLSVAAVLLASAYGASLAARQFVGVNLALCVATSKYFAYYPTLVDLGAYAVIMTAMYAVVRRRPLAAPVLAVMAALSREFGLMVAIFGFHRETRLSGRPLRAIAMYGPAVAAAVALRYVVSRYPGFGLLTPSNFADNLQLWNDEEFVAFFFYFCATVFGGISLLVVSRPGQCARFLRSEPEWITFAAPILAIAAVGSSDLWRYLAYVLPVAIVLVAACDREWTNGRRAWIFSIGTIATVLTQRPFERIDSATYFTHWFPYYVIPSAQPDDLERLWLYWGRMMMVSAAAIWLMAAPETPRRLERIESMKAT
jgi:hypothetical protein